MVTENSLFFFYHSLTIAIKIRLSEFNLSNFNLYLKIGLEVTTLTPFFAVYLHLVFLNPFISFLLTCSLKRVIPCFEWSKKIQWIFRGILLLNWIWKYFGIFNSCITLQSHVKPKWLDMAKFSVNLMQLMNFWLNDVGSLWNLYSTNVFIVYFHHGTINFSQLAVEQYDSNQTVD